MDISDAIKTLRTEDCEGCTFGGFTRCHEHIGCEVKKALETTIEAAEFALRITEKIGERIADTGCGSFEEFKEKYLTGEEKK